jgi:hypothetical protein
MRPPPNPIVPRTACLPSPCHRHMHGHQCHTCPFHHSAKTMALVPCMCARSDLDLNHCSNSSAMRAVASSLTRCLSVVHALQASHVEVLAPPGNSSQLPHTAARRVWPEHAYRGLVRSLLLHCCEHPTSLLYFFTYWPQTGLLLTWAFLAVLARRLKAA